MNILWCARARLDVLLVAMLAPGALTIQAAQAQSTPTNMAVMQQLAIDCLAAVPAQVDTLHINSHGSVPFILPSVTRALQDNGHVVYMGSDSTSNRPELSWMVERVDVGYARAKSRAIQRTVRLDLQYMLVAANRNVIGSGPCDRTFTDVILRDELTAIESAAYPETQAEPPKASWLRRYVEPVVLAVATGLAAFLFFNLRSDRADA